MPLLSLIGLELPTCRTWLGGASTVIRNTYSLTPLIVKIPFCLTLRKGKEFPKPDWDQKNKAHNWTRYNLILNK